MTRGPPDKGEHRERPQGGENIDEQRGPSQASVVRIDATAALRMLIARSSQIWNALI